MQRIYDTTKARAVHIGAIINSACDIIDADEQMITLGFAHEAIMARAQQPQNLQVLTEVAGQVLGRPVNVRCVHDPRVEAWTRRFPRSALVRAAQDMGARVLPRDEE
jgi:hypothetical protein